MLKQSYNPDLAVVFDYHTSTEINVLAALKRIDDRLDTPFDVSLSIYGKFAYHLGKLHFLLDYDFSSIRKKMISNLNSNGKNIDINGLALRCFDLETNIDSKKETIPDSFDKIQLLQIDYLCDI